MDAWRAQRASSQRRISQPRTESRIRKDSGSSLNRGDHSIDTRRNSRSSWRICCLAPGCTTAAKALSLFSGSLACSHASRHCRTCSGRMAFARQYSASSPSLSAAVSNTTRNLALPLHASLASPAGFSLRSRGLAPCPQRHFSNPRLSRQFHYPAVVRRLHLRNRPLPPLRRISHSLHLAPVIAACFAFKNEATSILTQRVAEPRRIGWSEVHMDVGMWTLGCAQRKAATSLVL